MRALYRPGVNTLARSLLRPFAPLLPPALRFGVTEPFTLALPNHQTIRIAGNETSYVSKVLFWDGWRGYEPHLFAVFTAMAERARVFVDVGANIGYYSLLGRAYNPALRIVAVEPMPSALHFLRANLSQNGLAGVDLAATALSDAEGTIAFYEARNRKFLYLEHHLTGASGLHAPGDGYVHDAPIEVPVTTLDALVHRYALDGLDLLKIDAEGAEAGVLRGGTDALARYQPVVLFECDPGNDEAAIEATLRAHGYVLYNARPEGLRLVEALAPHNATAHDFVAVPPRWSDLVGVTEP